MIEPRVYRAAFVPAVLAVVLVMFSLESRPSALPQGLAADVVFDGDSATTTARSIVRAQPDRRAGNDGDRATAIRVADDLRGRGFTVQSDSFRAHDRDLVNVVGRRAGRTQRQIVVVAARDATGVPDAQDSGADTAALLQFARVFQGRPTDKTLVLASVDGATLGNVGAARFADSLGDPGEVDGVVVLSALGASGRRQPSVLTWSGGTQRAGLRLVRTATASVREELRRVEPGNGFGGQVARLAFPLGLGGQSAFLDRGYDAVAVSGDGERPDLGGTRPESVDPDRLGGLGRAALRTLSALDQARSRDHGPKTYLTAVSQVMPGWVISLLGLTLILPALVASVDAFARVRRRKLAVLPWFGWILARALGVLVAVAVAYGLALVGAFDPPDAAVSASIDPFGLGQGAIVVALVLVAAGAWFGLRQLAAAVDPDFRAPAVPGAAVAVSLALVAGMLVLWLANPFSALLMVPALHLWMLAVLVEPAAPRRARLAMIAGGLVLPALMVVYLLTLVGSGPLGGAWYLVLLVTGGHVTLVSTALGALFAALLGSLVAIVRGTTPGPPPPAREVPSVRGPASYAGPGSLGGTDSALR